MPALQPPLLDTSFRALPFALKGVDNTTYSLSDVMGPNGLLVMFICNHCPFVQAILDKLVRDTAELKAYGIGSVGIMSNDVENYPEDSFPNMQKLAKEMQFSFPYLIDETQGTAKAYGAVCTPDFFGFNRNLELQYRGRLDSAGREPIPNAPRELFEAMVMVAQTGKGPENQKSSIGCSIKWK